MRLNKFLTKAGVCSRRKAEQLINEGRVTVNGKQAQITTAVGLEDQVKVDGRSVMLKVSQNYETYAFYKPRGVICTLSPKERPNLKDCLPMEGHFFPVGRLDKESEGLLIITSDGELANKLTHPSFEHEKEYLVWLHSDFDDQFLNNLLEGVVLDGKLAKVTSTDRLSKNKFKITLKEGRNRQIRRMVELLGHDVQKLKRVRIGAFVLSLKNGEYKRLGKTEILRLQKPIK